MAVQTLGTLVAQIQRRYGFYHSGTADGGTSTTVIDSDIIAPADSVINHFTRFTSGTYSGSERLISDNAAGSITFTPALGGSVVAGVTYEVSQLQYADVMASINTAIRMAGKTWLAIKSDETISLVLGTHDYTLPTDCAIVMQVFAQWGTDADDVEYYPVTDYEIVNRTLVIHDPVSAPAGTIATSIPLRLVYMALPAPMTATSDSLSLREEDDREAGSFVEEYALHILHQQAIGRNLTSELRSAHFSLSTQHLQIAMAIKNGRRSQQVSKQIRRASYPRFI